MNRRFKRTIDLESDALQVGEVYCHRGNNDIFRKNNYLLENIFRAGGIDSKETVSECCRVVNCLIDGCIEAFFGNGSTVSDEI